MTLFDRAVLELEMEGTSGEFHFMGTDFTGDLSKEYMLDGTLGQLVQEGVNTISEDGDTGQDGFSLDAGEIDDTITLSFESGYDADEYNDIPMQWGDGSSGTDKWDATGAHPILMAQVLRYWAKRTRTDSFRAQARLHFGGWTDGSINGEEGIFGEPIAVELRNIRTERDDRSPASSFEGTVEVAPTTALVDLESDNENNPEQIPDA